MTLAEITGIILAIGSLSGLILYFLNRQLADRFTIASTSKTNKEIEQIEQDVESKYALQVKKWLEDLESIKVNHDKELQKKDDNIEQLTLELNIYKNESGVYKWKVEQCGRAHRRLFSDIHIPYWECSEDGKLIYSNGAWLTLFGLTKDSALGEGWLAAIPEEDKKRLLVEWYAKVVDEVDGDITFRVQNAITNKIVEVKAIYTVKFGADSRAYKIIGITLPTDSPWLTNIR